MEYTKIEKYIETNFGEIPAYLFAIKVKDILPIYYVAVRGRDSVEGAVQRVLNKRRITSIKSFILDGNMFFNTFILNWTDENHKIIINENTIEIPTITSAAQVIDGQHRLEGLKMAVSERAEIGEQAIVVIMTKNLSTKQAATIFLNINAEQKPVPQSLVYDLFGEVGNSDSNLVRATDIAKLLHSDSESPYYQHIKLPGTSQGSGKVDLSTVVNALKPYIDKNGVFKQYNITDFEIQYRVIVNYFSSLKYFYDQEGCWQKTSNPFMSSAGFFAGIEFFCKDLIGKCAECKSFEVKTIIEMLRLDETGLIFKDDIKKKQGMEQRNVIYSYLKNALLREVPSQDEYKL